MNERYGTEEKCEAALFKRRWPKGFVCPPCGSKDHGIAGKRRLYMCHGCRVQTSLKSGTTPIAAACIRTGNASS